MYKLDIAPPQNISPWEISFFDRLSYLTCDDGRKICVIVYEQADTSTFRYRGYNIYQSMQESKSWKTVYFFEKELEDILFYLDRIAIVVACRTRWSFCLQKFIDIVKQKKIPFFFDTDDCVYDLDILPVVMNTLNAGESEDDYTYWFSYISRIGHVAKQADGYICTNAYLGDKLSKKYGKDSYIIPNFLNREQIVYSQKCLKQKKEKESDDRFVIGYFSGTPSHVNDFQVVYHDLIQLLYRYPDIYLYIVGFMDFPSEMEMLLKLDKIRLWNLVDFVTLQKLMAEVDVNIVPLVENGFTNCKSELKYFEAALVDTITCATPIYTYKNAIQNGVNGFLCTQTQWYDTLESIYLKKTETDQIVKSAHEMVLDQYYGENIRKRIEEVYSEIVNG